MSSRGIADEQLLVSDELTARAFRDAMRRLPTAVAVVTAMTDDGPVGMIVGTFTSVSLSPLLVGFLGASESQSVQRLAAAPQWAVNVLPQDDDAGVRAFLAPAHERFERAEWELSALGNPVLTHCPIHIEARRHDVLPAGDHQFLLGEVQAVRLLATARPMVFYGGAFHRLDPSRRIERELWDLSWAD